MNIDDIFEGAPKWLKEYTCLLSLGGSNVYGCATESSDTDLVGICNLPREYMNPVAFGYILGFDQIPSFTNWTKTTDKLDVSVHSIITYFKLLSGGNPNLIECLCTKDSEIIFCTGIGWHIRNNRNLFIAKNLIKNTLAYAVSQIKRLERTPEGKRLILKETYGYDTKSASHAVRLLDNCKQLLETGTMCLDNKAQVLRDIRNGLWSLEELDAYCSKEMKDMEQIKNDSSLPDVPGPELRELLRESI